MDSMKNTARGGPRQKSIPVILDLPKYVCFWEKFDNGKWVPETREYGTMCAVNGKIFMYGGMARDVHGDLSMIDVNAKGYKWVRIPLSAEDEIVAD